MLRSRRLTAVVLLVGVALFGTALAPVFGAESRHAAASDEASRFHGGRPVKLAVPSRQRFSDQDPLEDLVDPETGDEFWVDKRRGKITYFSSPRAYEPTRTTPWTDAEIDVVADDLVRAVYDRARLSKMQKVVRRVRAGEESETVVEYSESISGVRTFNSVRVSLDDAGRVRYCNVVDEDVVVNLNPRISRQEALTIAVAESAFPRHSGESAVLQVIMLPTGEQRLVWDTDVRTGDSAFGCSFMAYVDAQSGQVLMSATADR